MKCCWLITLQALVWATIGLCSMAITRAALFSLEVVEPTLQVGDIGTLRVIYDGALENYSFEQGGLDLKLTSSNSGVIKFLDAQILNDSRWDIATTDRIADDSIGRLFAASLFSPGLAGTGSRIFAEIKYIVSGSGATDVLLDVGGEDPVVHGAFGDVSNSVFSRGACLGECLPGSSPVEINLGESWARLKAEMYTAPVQYQPLPPVTPQPQPVNPVTNPLVTNQPIINEPAVNQPVFEEPVFEEPSPGKPTISGMFSLEVVEPALEFGDTGKLRVIYNGGTENHAFENGGIGLKLTSSNPGVIKFSDAQILNADGRWVVATARGIGDDAVAEMFASSLLTPGLAGTGPQIFAEIEYSLLGPGFTDLALDIQGEDPLVDGSVGDVSSGMLSRGACLGDCLGTAPVEIDLGESWARLREEMYAPPVFPQSPAAPEVDPVVVDPVIGGPIVGDPVVEVPPVSELPTYNIPDVDDPSVIDVVLNPPTICEAGVCSLLWPPQNFIISENGEIQVVKLDPDYLSWMALNSVPINFVHNFFTMCDGMPIVAYDGDAAGQTFAIGSIMNYAGVNRSADATIPEPCTAALVGLALFGLTSFRRHA